MFNTFNFMAINSCCILGGPYYPTLPYMYVNASDVFRFSHLGTPSPSVHLMDYSHMYNCKHTQIYLLFEKVLYSI